MWFMSKKLRASISRQQYKKRPWGRCVAQWDKLPLGTPTFHNGVLATVLPIQLPANEPGKAAKYGTNTCVPVIM